MSRPLRQAAGLPTVPAFSGAGYLRKKTRPHGTIPADERAPGTTVSTGASLPVLLLTAPIVAPSARALWRALSRRIDLNDPTEILAGVQHLINQIDAAPRPEIPLEHVPSKGPHVAKPTPHAEAEVEVRRRDVLILTARIIDAENAPEHSDLCSNLLVRREP